MRLRCWASPSKRWGAGCFARASASERFCKMNGRDCSRRKGLDLARRDCGSLLSPARSESMNVTNDQIVEEAVVNLLRATRANDAETAPTRHSRQTDQCPNVA